MTTKTPAAPPPPILTFAFTPAPGITRTIKVHTPDEGQLAVWAASAERFQSLGAEWADQERVLAGRADDDPDVLEYRLQRNQQATRLLSRALKIASAAMVEQADRDWLEDSLLDRKFDLAGALGVITGAVDELRRLRAETTPVAPTNGPAKSKAKRV